MKAPFSQELIANNSLFTFPIVRISQRSTTMDQTAIIIIVIVAIVFIVIMMNIGSGVKGSVPRQEDINWLNTNGDKIIAQVTKVEPRTENNEQYYRIIAERPGTNQTDTFEDLHYLYDLRQY